MFKFRFRLFSQLAYNQPQHKFIRKMSDPCSFSKPESIKTNHVDIDWTVDFDRSVLRGHADLSMQVKSDKLTSVVLDTRDLNVSKVLLEENEVKFLFGDKSKAFGTPLNIDLGKTLNKDEKFKLRVVYETSQSASALQWLGKEQTAGKKQPYMFSQCQAIHARSILPCQDSPSDKFPYDAKVTVKAPLTVLMSAVEVTEKSVKGNETNTFYWKQKVAIPSYLVAVVAGLLEKKKIGDRSAVWAEHAYVDDAAEEFKQTEEFIAAGERIVGEYKWGRYDLLVLPPTFPYGGMENPCLTFVTPTLLAGDRSLANVVAHEIAHSWTGNLVTNKTWEHFWLNEGHTVFLERKIVSSFYGKQAEQMREFLSLGGLKALKDSVDLFVGRGDAALTNLVVKLDGIDPDDSFSSVPYEKGYTLLFYLEQLLGGPAKFDPFLLSYINKFKYKSLTTEDWKEHLYNHFADQKDVLDKVDWDSWFNKPGMPPVIPEYDNTLALDCFKLCERWTKAEDYSKFNSNDIKDFSSQQKIEFLAEVLTKDPISEAAYAAMDRCYNFSASGNSEIKFRWLMMGLKAHVESSVEPAIKMATSQGRMKFTRPLFRSLGAWSASRDRAVEALRLNYKFMHPTTAALVASDLKVTKF